MRQKRYGPALPCLLLFCVVGFLRCGEPEEPKPPSPPKQPKTGPGGASYTHAQVVRQRYGRGDGEFWIFEPAKPKPKQAPVIVFTHGWSAMAPGGYMRWIEHLVKRGRIVIYPRYQASVLTDPNKFTQNAIGALKEALTELEKGTHVRPDLDRCAVVGHSFGGVIAANLAALAAKNNLPRLKAVMCVEPGTGGFGQPHADYAQIPKGTLLLCIAAEHDWVVRETDARRIFKESKAVEGKDKNYILLRTDRHGEPYLSADHWAPVAGGVGTDALDWYGFWKWFDALTDAAFDGKNRAHALGNTAQQRFMGKWSDGKPVREPVVTVGE